MVSRKWTCQLSSSHTLPMAAATPPSAITVWALPSRDLQTSAVRSPRSLASMAALRPAQPAPMTMTSKSCVSVTWPVLPRPPPLVGVSVISEELVVRDPAGGDESDVQIGAGHEDEADPGDLHVTGVERGQRLPHAVPDRVSRELLERPAAR